MVPLTPADRAGVWGQVMEGWSRRQVQLGALNKYDLRAAVGAIDEWVVANAASLNLAIPPTARTALTPAQKAELFATVVLRRFEVT